MNNDKYILDDNGQPVAEPDLMRWGKWFQTGNRVVAKEQIGEALVSTVFLGLDHNYEDSGPPVLWETLVFGNPLEGEMDRCSGSREQAEAMHARMVERVKAATKP